MLTEEAMNALRSCLKDGIAYARYKANETYYRAEIEDREILSDGRVAIAFIIDNSVIGGSTVTEVQLFDHNGVPWANKAENITRQDVQEGILYRFRFTIIEE